MKTTRPNPNSTRKKEAIQEVTARQRLEAIGQNIRSFWETNRKTFCALLILHLIGISAIVRANVPYVDDVRRGVSGQRDFGFGRKLADALAVLIHADKVARDVSPLTQLLAVCFLSAACCIVIHLVTEKREFDLWPVIAVLPLGLNPYFLECLSYKWDSPYMALSILVSVLPFLLPVQKKDLPLYGAVSALCCLAMCLLYQASSGVYPMLTVLLCFHRWNKGLPVGEVVRFGLVSALGYCVGVLSFNLFFMNGLNYWGYVDPTISLAKVPENLATYFGNVRADFKPWWLALIAVIALLFVYAAVRDTAGRPRALAGLLAAAAVLAMLFLCFGAYIVFTKPLTDPRAMYGFGIFIAFVAVYAAGGERRYPARLACLCLSWAFLTFALVVGNALAENQRYLEFRLQTAIQDMCETQEFIAAVENDQRMRVQYTGSISRSPILSVADDDHTLLYRLVPNIIRGSWAHGRVYFQWYYGFGSNITVETSENFRELNLPVLKESFYHTIRGDGEHILIQFKN